MLKLMLAVLLATGVASATQLQRSSGGTGNFCQGCKSIVSFGQALNSSSERSEYKELLTRFCELYYPVSTDFQQGPCLIFVEGFFHVLDHVDPVYHCDQIGACGNHYSRPGVRGFLAKPDDKRLSSRGNKMVCQFCEQIVEQSQAALLDPATVDQIKRQLDSFCDFLRVIEQDKQCHRLLSQYLEQALDFIRNIDPLRYCKSIQLCPASHFREELVDENDRVEKKMLESLPTLSDFNNFGIETSVVIGERPTVSHIEADATNIQPNHYGKGPNCAICKALVAEMFKFLRNNRTEANIVLGLNRVCKLIYPRPGPSQDQCHSMVKAYTRELIELLIDETDPQVICMLLSECVHQPEPKQITAVAESGDKRFDLFDLMAALDPTVKRYSERACFECRMFIDYLKSVLDNPASQGEVKLWLKEHLCKDLPNKNLVDNCAKMVDDYAETLFKTIVTNLNSRTACVELGVCRANSFHSLVVNNAPTSTSLLQSPRLRHRTSTTTKRPVVTLQAQMDTLCDQCVGIVTQFDEYLSTHSIDKDVSVLIDQVCNKMPNEQVKSRCVLIVRAFGSEIAQWIANMDSPKDVCKRMLLCPVYSSVLA